MNYAEAQLILSGRLCFGDDRQMRARDFLRELERARERISSCSDCGGLAVNARGKPCQRCAAHFEPDILRSLGVSAEEEPP